MTEPFVYLHAGGSGVQSLCLGLNILSVSRPTGDQVCFFFCSSIPVVLFDNPGISKCLNTLYVLSPHLCFMISFICDLFVTRNGTWTEQIYVFTTREAEGEGWDPKLVEGPLLSTPPPPNTHTAKVLFIIERF